MVGAACNIGDHAYIEGGARLGDRVTVKNAVLVWDKVTVDDDVFLGPNVVFTNDLRPRSFGSEGPGDVRAHPRARRERRSAPTRRSCAASPSATTRSSPPARWSTATCQPTPSSSATPDVSSDGCAGAPVALDADLTCSCGERYEHAPVAGGRDSDGATT